MNYDETEEPRPASTELTGGAGFSYEDRVVAYYLVALLREEVAIGIDGAVTRVAVQQSAAGEPLDDLVIDTCRDDEKRRLSLQVKRKVTISAARSNKDFRSIIENSVLTRAKSNFRESKDRFGFLAEHVADLKLRGLNRLIKWAKDSPTGKDFDDRFRSSGGASVGDKSLREELKTPIEPSSLEKEVDFYRHFVALRLDDISGDTHTHAEVINRLTDVLSPHSSQSPESLLASLCYTARNGAGTGKIWTRATLLDELKDNYQLKTTPSYVHDIDVLSRLAQNILNDISSEIEGTHIRREALIDKVKESLDRHRLTIVTGLPGTGKSVIFKSLLEELFTAGPVFALSADRIKWSDWQNFASEVGLNHELVNPVLAEIGITGHSIIFIDGIDRIPLSHRKLITDLIHSIENDPYLDNWKILATSRDQGLETLRAWVPTSFYRDSGIGDICVTHLSDDEAEILAKAKPELRPLLFGLEGVQEITRRPFFAAILAKKLSSSVQNSRSLPSTEIELIEAWWSAGGYNSETSNVLPRQRAILELAKLGSNSLGKMIAIGDLSSDTQSQLFSLIQDQIIRQIESGHSVAFSHDIFFEWSFYRWLIDSRDSWYECLSKAGEPPLLARVVNLLSQFTITHRQTWLESYRTLESKALRHQWKRVWLTGPPSTPRFTEHLDQFEALLSENEWNLLEKFLVWFQAEHTVPNPIILSKPASHIEGSRLIRIADSYGWPSDFSMWSRVINWLLANIDSFPTQLIPRIVKLFEVWLNFSMVWPNELAERLVVLFDDWLVEMERYSHRDPFRYSSFNETHEDWSPLIRNLGSSLEKVLRENIFRYARNSPDPAISAIDRAISNGQMRREIYTEIIDFSPLLTEIAPEKIFELAIAELIEELPKEEIERERQEAEARYQLLKKIREKPEEERTERENKIISIPRTLSPSKRWDLDDLSIEQHHHNFYYPPSPTHEPFFSLFKNAPNIALKLIRGLSNHAINAWNQIHEINSQTMGTPAPIELDFPWGRQKFWSDFRVYSWFKGKLAPHPLECAYLALTYWAHKQLDKGERSTDEIIQDIIEGNESSAVLGIACSLAMEEMYVSETVLPIATCQRLWHADIDRLTSERTGEIDLLGLNFDKNLSEDKRQALDYLKERKSRLSEIRTLAVVFVTHTDKKLRERYKNAVAEFPVKLPYEYEEQRNNENVTNQLLETANIWKDWGDAKNYTVTERQDDPDSVVIEYSPPEPLSPRAQEALKKSNRSIQDHNIMYWATKSLEEGVLDTSIDLNAALKYAQEREDKISFEIVEESGNNSAQSAISATAAVATIFLKENTGAQKWAWEVLSKVDQIKENDGLFSRANNPWHPLIHLIYSLRFNLKGKKPLKDSAERLFKLTIHPLEQISIAALTTLLGLYETDKCLVWAAACLASDLFLTQSPDIDEDGTRDYRKDIRAKIRSLKKALKLYAGRKIKPLTPPPAPWINAPLRRRFAAQFESSESIWREPDESFNFHLAYKIVKSFPVEKWCLSNEYRAPFLSYLDLLTYWTNERLNPGWISEDDYRSSNNDIDTLHWRGSYSDLISRCVTLVPATEIIEKYLKIFSKQPADDNLSIIANFSEMTVCRHVYDADLVNDDTIILLEFCLDRLLMESVFQRDAYRAGQIHGWDQPKLVQSLLFVSVENAVGAKRFANGDWSDISAVMPIIDKLARALGWSSHVMESFLTLCERAGPNYPLDDFADQVIDILRALGDSRADWTGLLHAARISNLVQELADANYPLSASQSRKLLVILDNLIDLGDRRSAAIEQSETFRILQTSQDTSADP